MRHPDIRHNYRDNEHECECKCDWKQCAHARLFSCLSVEVGRGSDWLEMTSSSTEPLLEKDELIVCEAESHSADRRTHLHGDRSPAAERR
ncbi:hypothetical protein FQA47_018628 [Oryzias melastigma]|uniref:Uncharacterized protein n=1 Tax=Oryzias melastigma TaxID=30732 RepID=A0A834C4P6_ORYME|nr:hypothetical protein FQA47_018628 [Oryzias melastigma]